MLISLYFPLHVHTLLTGSPLILSFTRTVHTGKKRIKNNFIFGPLVFVEHETLRKRVYSCTTKFSLSISTNIYVLNINRHA